MNDVTGKSGLTRYKKAMKSQIAFPERLSRRCRALRADRLRHADAPRNEDQRPSAADEPCPIRVERRHRIGRRHGARQGRPDDPSQEGVHGAAPRRDRARRYELQRGPGREDQARAPNQEQERHVADGASSAQRLPALCSVCRSSLPHVAETETPAVLDMMGNEFFRQFARLSS
jgi:hypothetical protein